jgi:pimeloyl-ACP methyl ester carboxylesterase
MRHWLLLSFLLLPLTALANPPTTSNLAREKAWADEVADQVVVGDAIWLKNRGQKFLGLYAAPADKTATRAVILIHGRGVHPAWGFIENLRVDLTEAGYHTLSLQMPILENEAKFLRYAQTFPEANERIDAGIAYLKERGIKDIYLIGHSSGAMTVAHYAAERPKSGIRGVVGVGLSQLDNGPPAMRPATQIARIHIPLLDIYGSDDLIEVTSTAKDRRDAASRAGNRRYQVIVVKGASHFFADKYDPLREHIFAWLKQQ